MEMQAPPGLCFRSDLVRLAKSRLASLCERWEGALDSRAALMVGEEREAVRAIIGRFSRACLDYLEHGAEEILEGAAAWLGPAGMVRRFTLAQLQEIVGGFHRAMWPLAAVHANGDVSLLLDATEAIADCSLVATRAIAAEYQRRILDEANETAEFGLALAEMTRSVTSSLNLDEVLRLVCQEGARLMEVDGALVRLLDGDGSLVCRAAWGEGYDALCGSAISADDARLLCGRAVGARRVQTATTNGVPLDHPRMPVRAGQACLAVPIIAKGEVLGAMLFVDRCDRGRFDRVHGTELLLTAELVVAQIALAIYNARLHAQVRGMAYALDHIGECVLVVDAEGRIAYANQAVQNSLGYNPSALMGQSLLLLDGQEGDDTPTRQIVRESFTGIREGEVLWRHQGGTPVPFHLVSAPMESDTGGAPRVVILARDVTEEKRRDAADRAHHALLQSKNQELEAFVYTVSHDLRAPLVALHGLTSLLRLDFSESVGESGAHLLSRLDANVLRMERLIEDLLQFSRVGRHVKQEETAVADVVSELLEERQARLDALGIAVTVAEPLPVVRADRTSLRQVLGNLLDNAAKFMGDDPSPAIRIAGSVENGTAHLIVSDNGIGIAPEYHEKVFAVFQRLQKLPDVDGTGIGLAIVRKVVEAYGGRVWIESEAGKGCAVHVTLPSGDGR